MRKCAVVDLDFENQRTKIKSAAGAAAQGVFHNMFGFVLLIAHTRGPPHRSANSHFSYLSFRLTNNALPAAPGGQRAGDFGPSAAAAHSP